MDIKVYPPLLHSPSIYYLHFAFVKSVTGEYSGTSTLLSYERFLIASMHFIASFSLANFT